MPDPILMSIAAAGKTTEAVLKGGAAAATRIGALVRQRFSATTADAMTPPPGEANTRIWSRFDAAWQ